MYVILMFSNLRPPTLCLNLASFVCNKHLLSVVATNVYVMHSNLELQFYLIVDPLNLTNCY
jgi:hypothetical protein